MSLDDKQSKTGVPCEAEWDPCFGSPLGFRTKSANHTQAFANLHPPVPAMPSLYPSINGDRHDRPKKCPMMNVEVWKTCECIYKKVSIDVSRVKNWAREDSSFTGR